MNGRNWKTGMHRRVPLPPALRYTLSMFDSVDPKQSFPALERGILKYWQEEDTFKRSIHLRTSNEGSHPGDPLNGMAGADKEERFCFYDGPPFATGLPH